MTKLYQKPRPSCICKTLALTMRRLNLHSLLGHVPEVHMGHVIVPKKLSSLPHSTCTHVLPTPGSPVSFIRHHLYCSSVCGCPSRDLASGKSHYTRSHRILQETHKREESTANFSSRDSPWVQTMLP